MFDTRAKSKGTNISVKKQFRGATAGFLLLALTALSTLPLDVFAAGANTPGYQQPLFNIGDPGFIRGCDYQVWTNGPSNGIFQYSTTGAPAITGQGAAAYSGVLTAAPFVNINGNPSFAVGSKTSLTPSIPPYYLPHGPNTDNVSIQWDCYFLAPTSGGYEFSTTSDDGSLLYIGQTQVVFNNRSQGATTVVGPYQPGTFNTVPIYLDAGYHKMTIMWANGSGGYVMSAAYYVPSGLYQGPVAGATNIDNGMWVRRMPTPAINPGTSQITGTQTTVAMSITYPANLFPSGAPPGAAIYYTTDGTIPTTGSQKYGGQFNVSIPRIITAFASAPGYDPSDYVVVSYTQTPAPDPVFVPPDGTTFTGTRTVTITSNVPNAFIFYTLDGSAPTLQNYSGVGASPLTLTVSSTTTIQAFAFAFNYAQSLNTIQSIYTKTDDVPKIVSVLASGLPNQVNVVFQTSANPNSPNQNKVDQTTANTVANYSIKDNLGNVVSIISATLDAGTSGDFKTVRLITSPLSTNTAYTLTVNGVKDSIGNTMTVPSAQLFRYFDRGGLLYERWEGITGPDVTNLTSNATIANAIFPDFPSNSTDPITPGGAVFPIFQEPTNTNIVAYGSRMSGYFIAPKTATYKFAVVADDSALLSISLDDNPYNKNFSSAHVTTQQTAMQWNYDGNVAPENKLSVSMVQGKRYYIELLHKQDQGNDNAAVAYVFPPATFVDFLTPPIPEKFTNGNASTVQLTPAIDALRVVRQPQSQSATLDSSVNLAFDVAGSAPRSVQWSVDISDGNGQVDIPGATFGIYNIPDFTAANVGTNNTAMFQCRMTNLITTLPIYSNIATVTLVDTIPASVSAVAPAVATLGGVTNFPASGGTQAVLSGTQFIPGTTIAINGKVATNVTVTPTAITFIVPSSVTVGLYDIVLTKPGGGPVTLSKSFRYDDIPVGSAAAFTTFENTQTSGAVLTAKDQSDKIVSFKIVTQPTKGTVTLGTVVTNNASAPYTGTIPFTYSPNLNQNSATAPVGDDTFTFTANDGYLDSLAQTITIKITPVNNPPTITNPGNQTVTEDQLTSIRITGIAPGPVSATDEAGQTLTAKVALGGNNPNVYNFITKTQNAFMAETLSISQPVNGVSSVSFTPAFPGVFTLSVTITDSGSNAVNLPNGPNNVNFTTITFTVTVNSVNDRPIINTPLPQTGVSDQSGAIQLSGIAAAPLNNPDESSQNPLLTLTVTSSDPTFFTTLTANPVITFSGSPAMGTATINYKPTYARFGTVTITVLVDDHQPANNLTTIQFTLNLTPVNHPPTAVNDSYAPTTNKVFNVGAPGVLANDTDPDFNTLSVAAVPAPTQPTNGSVVLNSNGSFTYTPNPNFVGTDTFTYYATDGSLNSATAATVTLTVGANLPPVASDATATAFEDTAYSGTLTASDPNFDPLTFTILTQPMRGTLVLTNAKTGAFTYTPFVNLNGTDSFTFKVNDGQYDSNTGTQTINITPVNDAPVAVAANVLVGYNVPTTIVLKGTDIENDTLTFAITSGPLHGTLGPIVQSKNSTNTATVTYTPNPNSMLPDNFQFTVMDATLTSAPAQVNITITAKPVINPSMTTLSPNPAFVGSPVTGTAVSSSSTDTFTWNFGDPSVPGTVSGNPVMFTYNNSGQFVVTVIATSSEGAQSDPYTFTFNVGLGLSGTQPVGVYNSGVNGFLVGLPGITAGCAATLSVSDRSPIRTSFNATVVPIAFGSVSLSKLVGQTCVLTIGNGGDPNRVDYIFSVDASGRGKATGLTSLQINVTTGLFTFKLSGRPELYRLITELTNGRSVANLDVPVTLKLGDQGIVAMTFRMNYVKTGAMGRGYLIAPNGRKKR